MSDEDQPLALVVVGHATPEGRIRSIMKHQGWRPRSAATATRR
ncbi:MAG: hypothetical protein Ct9H300mP30_4180 [Methanobacteriota archaeon]|nr:MAG: hypothetical protein Ct9H300mP30_4180 [Euryarchaeota archaeon]